jgi:hypothetical protein
MKCNDDNKISGFETDSSSPTCFTGLHLLYSFLSIVFSALFYVLIICLTIFYFYPFNSKRTSTKIDTSADTFLYIFKMITVFRFVFLNKDWISIILLFLGSLLNLKRGLENPTYNNPLLESVKYFNLDYFNKKCFHVLDLFDITNSENFRIICFV